MPVVFFFVLLAVGAGACSWQGFKVAHFLLYIWEKVSALSFFNYVYRG